jgi:hypothetical protein
MFNQWFNTTLDFICSSVYTCNASSMTSNKDNDMT